MYDCIELLRSISPNKILGYRAPCFSLDRERLEIIRSLGFSYDASKISFADHPLYENLDITDFERLENFIFRDRDFHVFEANTLPILGRNVPTSGGGYLRIFPWLLSKSLIRKHLRSGEFYNAYLHPFELSNRDLPKLPKEAKLLSRLRFTLGHRTSFLKLENLIKLLIDNNYQFTTYAQLVT